MSQKSFFTSSLIRWNVAENKREMPWKGERDPYRIWLSEIILQQTQVSQGWSYYNRFIVKYPTVHHLAAAEDTEVFKFWEGLGYYSRCKNLLSSARQIVSEMDGKFPGTYKEILKLKGVGTYTASAITSFAYNLPYSVLDGNVFRVLARFFGISTAIDSTDGKKEFAILADKLLDKENPGIYNQSIMDFGATVCKPLPSCNLCPLNTKCVAYLNDMISSLPVKAKRIVRTQRWMYFLIVEHKGKVFIRKRRLNDIWQNLYEFILVEPGTKLSESELKSEKFLKPILGNSSFFIKKISGPRKQLLTHQVINGRFITISLKSAATPEGYIAVTKKELMALPFPKFITTYLQE